MKYGIRDHRGGGRSSGRETAARVAAGALALKILGLREITIEGRVEEIHGKTIPCDWEEEIRNAAAEQDSVGGIVEVIARGCPAGLGDPVFGKLDAAIAHALMGIGAVKGVEIGNGFRAARLKGSEQNDQMGEEGFLSNHAGGILGGISNGNEIVARIAVKPTPSIAQAPSRRWTRKERSSAYPYREDMTHASSHVSSLSRRRCSPWCSSMRSSSRKSIPRTGMT